MVEVLEVILPLIIYFLLVVLLIVIIILGIKALTTINLMNSLVEDVEKKLASVNRLFDFYNNICYKLNNFTELGTDIITKIFNRKDED